MADGLSGLPLPELVMIGGEIASVLSATDQFLLVISNVLFATQMLGLVTPVVVVLLRLLVQGLAEVLLHHGNATRQCDYG
eukprot:4883811-Karenia_brevis.AAC.1